MPIKFEINNADKIIKNAIKECASHDNYKYGIAVASRRLMIMLNSRMSDLLIGHAAYPLERPWSGSSSTGVRFPNGSSLLIFFACEHEKGQAFHKLAIDNSINLKKHHYLEYTEKLPYDHSATCNMDDDDVNNPCMSCYNFMLPIGCMKGEG